jgi:flagellar motor switch protein FliN/FliY
MSQNPIDVFVEAFRTTAGQILSRKASSPWKITAEAKPGICPDGAQLLTMLLVAEPSKTEAAIQLSLEATLTLAAALTGASTVPTQFLPDHGETVRAALAEACGNAAALVEGTQVKLQIVKDVNWTADRQFALTASDGTVGNVQLQLLFSAGWPAGKPASQSFRTPGGVDVSMLENVEIDVILQFGGRRLPLRDIGELRSGSVIELDKYVQDPAELMLGDRVVARGEVVVVDGNYGLRVTEVVDQK